MAGRSSADPDDLDAWVGASRQLDEVLRLRQAALARLHDEFTATSRWGHFDASSLIGAFRSYIGWNEIDAGWVAQIAAAFRQADSSGGVGWLPDAAIQAALQAAGLAGPRQSVTFDDPIAFGEPPTSGYANDPVNTASGNFVEVEADLRFGGLLRGLGFARTFNSRSDRVGPFGPGWASWATCRLHATPEGTVWESPSGQRATVPASQEGGFRRVAGLPGLVVEGEQGLALEWFGGGRWEFDRDGLPLRVEQGPGTEVGFRHEEGRLVGLTHQAGKRLTVTWQDERIVGLACSDGRRVDYRYDDAGNLTEVDGPQGLRRYEVDATGRVVAVVDADGVVEAHNSYDAEGRVVAQVSAHGRRTRMRYITGGVTVVDDDAGGPTNTYWHDDHGRLVGVVDGHGAELAKVYDNWGNPVATTDRKGATTLQEWDGRSRLVRQKLPSGVEFTFSYDTCDRVVEVTATTRATGTAADGPAEVAATTRYRYHGDERTPAEIVDPEGGVTRLEVEGGLVRRVVDPDGVEVGFAFDADGNLISTADAYGNTATLERDPAGRVVAAVSPAGRRTELRYDQCGRLVERRDPDGALWRFEHTPAGRLAAVVDPTGARREARHGANGEAEAVIDELGNGTTRRFDALGNLASVVEADGAKWEFTYDALCRLVGVHDPAGAAWLREYDADGNPTASIDPLGVRRSATVDTLGRITRLHDGATSVDFEYDPLGRATAHRRPDGTALHAAYDRCGRRTTVTDPLGGVTRYRYTPGGRLAQVASPLGHTTSYDYDRAGRLVGEVDPAGQRRSYRYDPDGLPTQLVEPTGETWRFHYDQAGRLASRRRPGGGTTRYAYDPAGRLTQVTDPAGGVTRFGYDPRGLLTEAVDANGGVTRYAYNQRGWLVTVTDPLGGVVERRYDEVGRVVAEVDPLGRTSRWDYDPAGRLTRHTDPSGSQLRWWHDQSGRIAGYGAGETPDVTVERDLLGRPVAVDEPGLHHQLAWDPLGRLVEKRRGDLELTWRYDADGRQVAVGYPDGTQTSCAYDPAGRPTSAAHPEVGTVELRHDGAGRLVAMTGPGMARRWHYRDGDLVGYEAERGGKRHTTQLVRDAAGRVVAGTRDGRTRRYRYDRAGQLAAVDASDGAWSFSYDPAGRLVAETGPEGRVAYAYDAAHQLLARRHGDAVTTFAYDAAGRRISETGPDQVRTFTWDDRGRLSGMQRRTPTGQTTTRLMVDALGDLAEVDEIPLLWDPTGVVSQLRWAGGTAVIGRDEPWATIDPSGAASWLDVDWQETVGDSSRDPWGADGQATAPVGADPVRLGWRGEVEVDGLVWLRHRPYDAHTRTFLSTDPLPGLPGSPTAANPYHYANNDPIGFSDPLGLRPLTDADLRAYRDAAGRNLFERGGDWAQDNWEYLAAGAAVVGGVALMATGVGAPAGLALLAAAGGGALIGAGASVGVQKFTSGGVDWGRVGIDAAIGGAAGPIGAGAAAATRLGSPLLRGAVAGATESLAAGAATRAAYGEDPFNPTAMGKDLLGGLSIGALGGRLGAQPAPRAASGAESAAQGARLRQHLRLTEQYGAGGVRELADGRIRYYRPLDPARKTGPMAGRRLAREWDPVTGRMRTWHETLDHQGRIRQVRPVGQIRHYTFDEAGNYTGYWPD